MYIRFCIFFILVAAYSVSAEELKEAKVTAVINEVNLLPNESSARKASVNDEVRRGTAVRTGVESRSELTFTDMTIARLGANTIFTVREGTRDVELGGGAILLRVPKNSGGAKISTAAVTAAITGTTVMMQYDAKSYAKFIVLEGTACMSLNSDPKVCVPVKAGQLLAVSVNPPPTSLPAPIDVDLKKLAETSALLSSEFDPLPSLDLISQAVQGQETLKAEDKAAETNSQQSSQQIVLASLETMINSVDQRAAVEVFSNSTPTPTPTPTPT
ncbi:MAG: FecR family protein, partial [Verrucomicrobiota bacterium]|nr:FecR family protein [Verrucomicrobiota bacterium]